MRGRHVAEEVNGGLEPVPGTPDHQDADVDPDRLPALGALVSMSAGTRSLGLVASTIQSGPPQPITTKG